MKEPEVYEINDMRQLKKYAADLVKLYKAEKSDKVKLEKLNDELMRKQRALKKAIRMHKQAEKKLSEANKEKEVLLRSIASIMICIDNHDMIYEWNTVAEKVLGISRSKVMRHRFNQIRILWDWGQIFEAISKSIIEHRTINLYNILLHKQYLDDDYFLHLVISPIFDRKNHINGYIIYGDDITEKKMLESQLMETNKMETIGQLTAGITHEINSPLNYVSHNLYMLHDTCKEMERVMHFVNKVLLCKKDNNDIDFILREAEELSHSIDMDYVQQEIPKVIATALKGVNHIAHIVDSMKNISHPQHKDKNLSDINKLINYAIDVSCNEWKYIAHLKLKLDPSISPVECFPVELSQVFLNLIINAAHAISEKIGTGNYRMGTIIISSKQQNNMVKIVVKDDGIGIAEHIRNKIFTPFFTTKTTGKGTGQGLAIAKAIVEEEHQGSIDVISNSKWTSFIVLLPV